MKDAGRGVRRLLINQCARADGGVKWKVLEEREVGWDMKTQGFTSTDLMDGTDKERKQSTTCLAAVQDEMRKGTSWGR